MLIKYEEHQRLSTELEFHLLPGMDLVGNGVLCSPCKVFPRVTLGHSDLGGHSYIAADAEVAFAKIGNYTSIASGFVIGLGHPMHLLTASPVAWRPWLPNCPFKGSVNHTYEQTKIGSDVWIGAKVIVKAGVTIGDGAIVGAGSVVTRDIPPFTVAAGNPCRVLRDRFTPAVIARIEQTCWYEFDWRHEFVDWSSPDSALDSMERALTEGFSRSFRRFFYNASDTGLDLQEI